MAPDNADPTFAPEPLHSGLTLGNPRPRAWNPGAAFAVAPGMTGRISTTILLLAAALLTLACDPVSTTCDPYTGRCWASSPGWDALAEAQLNDNIQAAINQGIITEDHSRTEGDLCFDITGTDKHVCIVYVGGALLYGRPMGELSLLPANQSCWYQGAWTGRKVDSAGRCYGLLDSVAIELKPCIEGTFGCECKFNSTCNGNFVCVASTNGNNVCASPSSSSPCAHGMDVDLDGFSHSGACVPKCTQFVDDCGPHMVCSPKDQTPQGFCAYPN